MTTDDAVTLTVACACRLGSHTLTVPASTLTDGGTVTHYCATTGQLHYATADTTTDHTADGCTYSWCLAHDDTGQCSCPYAQASPHRREHCRYAEDNEQ